MIPQRIFNPWDPDISPYLYQAVSYAMPVYPLGPEAFYEGAPLGCAIAADELDIADEAMELVKVEWEVLDFVIDIEKALEPGAPQVYEYLTSFDPKTVYSVRVPFTTNPEAETFDFAPVGKVLLTLIM
jgi:CO/xanthine dehydrogenase Mo-binding subunit